MKFCKVLECQGKGIPEIKLLLRYKQLKKKIKAIPKAAARVAGVAAPDAAGLTAVGQEQQEMQATNAEDGAGPLSLEEQDFMSTLNDDVSRLNAFFIEKEEDAVISLQTMQDQLERAADPEQLNEIKGRLVNFHGELVMILHWSLINYSAIVKILKKHDKRSGVLLRAPYLANVLTQPFSSTNVMSGLVKRAEELVEEAALLASAQRAQRGGGGGASAAGRSEQAGSAGRSEGWGRAPSSEQQQGSSDDEGSSLTEVSGGEAAIRRTKLALNMWQSLAKSASTPSTIPNASCAASASAAGDGR